MNFAHQKKFFSKCYLLAFVMMSFSLTACKTIDVNNSSIIHPRKAESTVDASVERVAITAKDGTVLQGYFLAAPNARINIVWFGSSKTAIEDNMVFLNQYRDTMQANILAMNFRGYGESGGKPEWDELFSDGTQILQTMRMRPEAKQTPIVLHGFSLGSFVAVKVASEDTATNGLKAILIQGSGTNIDQWADYKTPWYVKPFINLRVDPKLGALDSLQVLPKIAIPTLIMIGKLDDDAPYQMSENLYQASTAKVKQLKVFSSGTHANLHEQSDYWSSIQLFLKPYL